MSLSKMKDDNVSFNDQSSTSVSPIEFNEKRALNDYYCSICKVKSTSAVTGEKHVSGQCHHKAVRTTRYGTLPSTSTEPLDDTIMQQLKVAGEYSFLKTKALDEVAAIQRTFDEVNDEPIVGLEYIQEIWRLDQSVKPLYYCFLCEAECQHIAIRDHVIGNGHRMLYLKIKKREIYERFARFQERKIDFSSDLALETQKLEKAYGKGIVRVAIEIADDKVTEDEDNWLKDINLSTDSSGDDDHHHSIHRKIDYPMDVAINPSKKRKISPNALSIANIPVHEIKAKFTNESVQSQRNILDKLCKGNVLPAIKSEETAFKNLCVLKDAYVHYLLNSMSEEEKTKLVEQEESGDHSWSKGVVKKLCGTINFDDIEVMKTTDEEI